MTDSDKNQIEKTDFAGKKVKVLGETFDSGSPECVGCGKDLGWRSHFKTREEKIKYLKAAERYWYNKEWFGSERRK